MKKLSLATAAFALLALAGCDRGDQDRLNEVDANAAADLNALANDAANVASEAEELENQAEQLNQEAQALENATGAETPYDENIAGM